jgi:hypothetical protein
MAANAAAAIARLGTPGASCDVCQAQKGLFSVSKIFGAYIAPSLPHRLDAARV